MVKLTEMEALHNEEAEAEAALEAARSKIADKRRELADQLRGECIAKIESAGLELKDVFDVKSPRGPRRPRNDPGHIYQDPDNIENTWGGRGRQPDWLKSRLGDGAKLEDFKIGA